jgi:hypothetical protein
MMQEGPKTKSGKQLRRKRRQMPGMDDFGRPTPSWSRERATSQSDTSRLIAGYFLLSETAADTELIEGSFDPLSHIETGVVR